MNVVVAYASKMNGTTEIAQAIARELDIAGLIVDVLPAQHLESPAAYDWVVLGSALYRARWRRPAMRTLNQLTADPCGHRVWLFQCAMPDAAPDPTPASVRAAAIALGIRPPVTFGGRIAPEFAVGPMAWIQARRPGIRDYRDWDQITRWARAVAAESTPAGRPAALPAQRSAWDQRVVPGEGPGRWSAKPVTTGPAGGR